MLFFNSTIINFTIRSHCVLSYLIILIISYVRRMKNNDLSIEVFSKSYEKLPSTRGRCAENQFCFVYSSSTAPERMYDLA